MQTIYLDISNKGVVPTVYAKQNDVGRKFAVILTDSGLPYIPEIGSVFSVWYKGASGEGNYTDIGDKSAFSLDGNKVEVEMIVQMLSAHGDGILCLTLNSTNGNQISSWNIPYLCEKVPGFESEGAKEYYTAFSESVKKLKQVTENLTPEAIGAAPSGYGLGVGSTSTPVKSITANGWYVTNENTPNAIWLLCHAQVTNSGNDITVEAWSLDGTTKYKITKKSGTWGEWEYFNPPMALDVEYRTTEQYRGKTVYTKLINCGNFPSQSHKYVAHNIANIETIVACDGISDNLGANLPYYLAYETNATNSLYPAVAVSATWNSILVNCSLGVWTGFTCYVVLKYTKTTD